MRPSLLDTQMAVYEVQLKNRQEVAEGTMAFSFEKPAGFEFKAGQFIDVTLIDPPETDAEGDTRGFSIASAPYEEDLMVATRMRDTAFKRVLKTMPLGTEVRIEGPFGSLTLHNNVARPAVFLAGGIGITPFRSILLQAAKDKLPHRRICRLLITRIFQISSAFNGGGDGTVRESGQDWGVGP